MGRLRSDRGAATVEFALVAGLLTFVVLLIVQLALGLYVRNAVIDACGEGARYGALLGGDADSGAERTRELISASVSERYAQDVSASFVTVEGIETLVITARAPFPVIGLLGIAEFESEGHGVLELLD